MAFSKSFPKTTDKSVYPKWEEIALSETEEKAQEILARKENIEKLKESIDDAGRIMEDKGLKPYQTDMIHIALGLFEKRASHEIYYKENKAKEIFDKKFSDNK